MKDNIHPPYTECQVSCSCGNSFQTRATVSEIKVAVCSGCHPFYTGNQKIVDAEGRIDRFRRKYGLDKTTAA